MVLRSGSARVKLALLTLTVPATPMKSLTTILMKGLAAVLPIGLTFYAVWWLARSAEGLMRGAITLFVPAEQYRPGMGILAGLLLLFFIGSIVNAYVVRRAISVWEEFLGRIPLVKTVYSAVRDVTRLLPSGEGRRDLQSVVVWRVGEARFLGFVTRDDLPELEKQAGGVDLVAVYFPLSYMLGGVTVYLPKTAVEHIDMPVEAAMRLALTGGMATAAVGAHATSHARPAPPPG
jgi:uncharacterized membrane protein